MTGPIFCMILSRNLKSKRFEKKNGSYTIFAAKTEGFQFSSISFVSYTIVFLHLGQFANCFPFSWKKYKFKRHRIPFNFDHK